ncbi:AzlC family ABC transporter permease [Agrococcus jejuensis]|uniref:Predicted branched-chain amino acid permease (Azaleucine resistance) n=1 Tax=Agrococcus jejuensis TaxID=399736 RepID=A0A1G8AD68_9MICO|nr:AzlC family ABC transporter permease [Agrococcus jejuensis]SDH18776.1 Predicted branched-chain amino acid permease (azaleucine resistance) [Agrococcus jejuensis]
MTRAQRSATERQAWRQGLSVAIATAAYGISFGALSVASGLDVWQTCALSLLMFSGGSQFALVGVVAGGGAPATAIASAAILGVRNTLYGLSVRPWLGAHGATRVPAAILTIDESTAVGLAQPDVRARRVGFWVTGIGIYLGWNATTLAGALVGDVLGDVRMWGLDAAAAAAFVGLLWPRLATRQAAAVGAASAVVAAALVPALPAGVPVLVAVVVAIVVGWTNWLGRPASAPDAPTEDTTGDRA